MSNHRIVSNEKWLTARKALLAQEKEFTRQRDRLTRERAELPWRAVEKEYVFEGPDGRETLAQLFEGRRQLLVYHFMFGPDWDEGCKSCSLLADHYEPAVVHLNQRDVTLVTVSRASLKRLEAFKKRMGWTFKWVSSLDNDFNWDYNVSFTDEAQEKGTVYYNYTVQPFPASEGPGISAFYKDDDGTVFHTYSSFARGLDMFISTYNLLDIAPMGRDEAGLTHTMEWVRHHDRYGK